MICATARGLQICAGMKIEDAPDPGPGDALQDMECEELLSIAAHEIRSPLTSLVLQLALCHRRCPEGADAEELRLLLHGAEQQARRIEAMVALLLDVSRMRSGSLELVEEPLELGALVRDVVARLEGEAERAGCQLVVHTGGPAEGRWDRVRMEQVVGNLVQNALKYGSGAPVEVRVEPLLDRVRLTVRDHGEGIAVEEQTGIFERFGRAARHRSHPGLGLGLYIVRRLLDAMGGTIRVESERGRGATFVVELPMNHPVQNGAERGRPASGSRGEPSP